MTLYYAMGGGLGHLTRARVYLENMGIKDFRILSGHSAANLIFAPDQLLPVPEQLLKETQKLHGWLISQIKQPAIEHLIIDTFPNGILGEIQPGSLNSKCHITYISRRLKWQAYKNKARPFPIDQVVMLEPLEKEHLKYLEQLTNNLTAMHLDYSVANTQKVKLSDWQELAGPIWLVVHSEPEAEMEELLAYAMQKAEIESKKPYFLVISNGVINLPVRGKAFQYFPAADFYHLADSIFTGCGFNSMHMPIPDGVNHYFLPFERKYDDQFWRARAIRKIKSTGKA